MIDSIFASDVAWRLGWTLLHSLWSILLIGALVSLILALLSRRTATLRYWVACCGMASLFVPLVASYLLAPQRPLVGLESGVQTEDAIAIAEGVPGALVTEQSVESTHHNASAPLHASPGPNFETTAILRQEDTTVPPMSTQEARSASRCPHLGPCRVG
jgi:hypothetical protein